MAWLLLLAWFIAVEPTDLRTDVGNRHNRREQPDNRFYQDEERVESPVLVSHRHHLVHVISIVDNKCGEVLNMEDRIYILLQKHQKRGP